MALVAMVTVVPQVLIALTNNFVSTQRIIAAWCLLICRHSIVSAVYILRARAQTLLIVHGAIIGI